MHSSKNDSYNILKLVSVCGITYSLQLLRSGSDTHSYFLFWQTLKDVLIFQLLEMSTVQQNPFHG